MAKNQYIHALNEVGQSIWYDNLSKDVLDSGELKQLIEDGVSGLTSNPTIFKKAIADTSLYDDEIVRLAEGGISDDDLCEELMTADVARAADLLKDTYERTRGADGYASIEVSPQLAHDTAGTIEAAKRLWGKLNRPNIMIKIPATDEGLESIYETLRAGINVNVTLIFSETVYRKVADAYIRALRDRSAAGEPVNTLASVASFFVSRVDALCEKKLEGKDASAVVGKIGIANSKCAYAAFQEIFSQSDFESLKSEGASVQRPLWASTGVKNPEYPELLYVEALVGDHTVNTLPPKTLKLLLKDATIKPQIESDLDQARSVLQKLPELDLDFEGVLEQLRVDGVKSFADSYAELVSAVGEKKKQTVSAA